MGLYCTRFGYEGEQCTKPEYWSGSSYLLQSIPSLSCPCRRGLECVRPGDVNNLSFRQRVSL